MKARFKLEDAVSLRELGFSYSEIAERLGCSVAWCSKNLVGTQKGITKVERLVVDGTKIEAIAILEEALCKLRAL